MTLRLTFLSVTLSGLLLLPSPQRLSACTFHTTLPQATIFQQIASATAVIAARPSSASLFHFEPVAAMKGSLPEDRPPHLVNSATRMRLARNPGEAVLFARDVNGSWNRLLVLDPATRPIVDLMIAHTEDWTSPDGIAERRDTFAELLNHPAAVIRELALRELDALPYKVLRERIYPVSADDLLRGIKDVNALPSAPIRILLLGINGEDRARDAIADQLDHMAKTGSATNLGAWATAMMEVSGTDGIAVLGRLFPGPDSRWTEAHRIELVRALALISSEGDPGLRNAVDGAIRTLVLHDPEAALLIVQAFGANGDYSQVGFIRELVVARAFKDRTGLMAATAYITRAGTGAETRYVATRPGQLRAPQSHRVGDIRNAADDNPSESRRSGNP